MNLNEKIKEYIEKYKLDSLEVSDSPRELIIMLLSDIKKCSIIDIKFGKCIVNDNDLNILESYLKEISRDNMPPQYLTEVAYIYKSQFYINKNVLIPRQDTETLIENAINLINKFNYKNMLDLCTGSGVIGISCALNSNIKNVIMTDISKEALDVARININKNNVSNKCTCFLSNMFDNLYKLDYKYDIIVSNPPYLTKNDMNNISSFVKKEPKIALYGGENGLDYYEIIYKNAKDFLNDGGVIVCEIGELQKEDVISIIHKYNEYKDISVIKDINNKSRVIVCHFQKK